MQNNININKHKGWEIMENNIQIFEGKKIKRKNGIFLLSML